MMRKQWIDPNVIYLPKPMNPRLMNQGFIESLRESMEVQGFLPQYPVKVFSTAHLSCVETDLQFACVSGMHRTTAARLAQIDQILCEVYTGDDDAFIEMMMTENFEFDPTQNSELGQVFSKKEKRNACKRLLYIPKFLRMTNTALAEAWHTPESNIRRWRKEVVATFDVEAAASSNGEGGAPTFPETLRRVGITPERLQELRDIDASREREDAEGNTVPVRSAPKEMSDEEKDEFWTQIRKDAGWHNDGWLEKHGIKDFDFVRKYLSRKYNIEDSYHMGEDMTTQQLRQVHAWILSDDPELIAGCKKMVAERELLESRRDALSEACGTIKKWLLDTFVQGNEWSQAYKDCKAAFTEAARRAGHADYCVEHYDFPGGGSLVELAEKFKSYLEIVDAVQRDISDAIDLAAGGASVVDSTHSAWVAEFCQKMEKDTLAKRQKLEKDWIKARDLLSKAFEAYPRNVSLGAFCYALEDEFYEKSGTYLKLLDLKNPSNRVHDDTLKSQTKYFKQAAKDLEANEKWVRAIAEEPEPSVDTAEFEDFEIGHIYIEVTGKNGKVFHPEDAEFVQGSQHDYDEEGNLKAKGLNLDAEAIACLSDVARAEILRICRYNDFAHYTSHFDIGGPRSEEEVIE